MNEKAWQRLEYDKIKAALMEYAVSYVGKKHVAHMQPLDSAKVLRKKLDETAEAKALLAHGASVPIPSLAGIEQMMSLLGTGYVFTEADFSHLHQFLASCAQLSKYMASKAQIAPRVSSYALTMYTLSRLQAEIEQCIRHGQVVDTASKDLLKVRKRIVVMEERLKRQLDSLTNKYRSIMQENVISKRNGKYVLPIKKEHRRQVAGSVVDESASGQTVYMEPAELGAVQFELAALKAEEAREVTKVLMQLSAVAEEFSQELHVNVETVGMYDFLFAKAKYALALGAVNVELNEDGLIDVKEARHPLLGRQMVPLDFQIGKSYKSLVITGPNTGGKTLALKTVGLLTAMVQSGLLVPVREGSRFAVFRNIAVDIGDGQSIEHALSTFSAHIHHVIEILRVTDSSTLVLIDEMASGTDPGEGVGLSIAILEELHRRGATVIATTHFNEIKNFAAATDGFQNARMEFDEETLQPLYRLRIGEAGQSYAFVIATKLGIPPEMIKRSREITQSGFAGARRGEQGAVAAAQVSEKQAVTMREAEGQAAEQQSNQDQQPLPPTPEIDGEPPATKKKPFAIGDCVFVSYLGRTGIVFSTADAKGNVGVMIQNQKFKINQKRLSLHIESKELYPADYDMDIVFETKENRKKRKLMSRKHVEGVSIETKQEG
ncbi:DNA mismatch repair protein MutS [Brevibacillus agri]|uniref:endonuclease MutS2 n=1 Tax=Brevibacillus agri TaxID=51101 RepID=UPI001EE5E2BE|nr:DNA mismatch repair protein MutS [Brevibacillus agri]MCG5254533.1 DNA mismatch repair protein MutS [Brevibacillus agri]MED1645923.1 DNA mismatch repair protein MutS [Brevibacillus agri]MED1656277.1 DNA mismatch repair protein MutS [Brevibacillus agri]MED1689417.1 DNA mismatch repair protein MutS [Brevibacillus agri]MED1691004.1 DNA mismatch repair protein MutS [Brevibacillus agri]